MEKLLKEVDEVLVSRDKAQKQQEKCCLCGEIATKGRISKDGSGHYFPEWLCQSCRIKEDSVIYPADLLLKEVERLNAKNASNASFEEAKKTWKAVADGKAEPPAVGEKEISHFAVLKKNGGGYGVVGINTFHAAAIAKAGLYGRILVYRDLEMARKRVERLEERRSRFEARKRDWQDIATGRKSFFGHGKKVEECEFPSCHRRAGEGTVGVVDGELVKLCPFCGAALLALRREGQCRSFAYFKGQDALERAKSFLRGRGRRKDELRYGLEAQLKNLKLVR